MHGPCAVLPDDSGAGSLNGRTALFFLGAWLVPTHLQAERRKPAPPFYHTVESREIHTFSSPPAVFVNSFL